MNETMSSRHLHITTFRTTEDESDTSDEESEEEDEEQEEEQQRQPQVYRVDVDISATAYANARKYYDEKKSTAIKHEKTIAASSKVKETWIRMIHMLIYPTLGHEISRAQDQKGFEGNTYHHFHQQDS